MGIMASLDPWSEYSFGILDNCLFFSGLAGCLLSLLVRPRRRLQSLFRLQILILKRLQSAQHEFYRVQKSQISATYLTDVDSSSNGLKMMTQTPSLPSRLSSMTRS